MRALNLLLFIVFLGCNKKNELEIPSQASVQGQVFVIRKDRVNVKLGGVTLYYIAAKTLRDRAEWIALNSDRMRFLRIYRGDLSDAQGWVRQTAQERTFQPEFRTFIRRAEDVIDAAGKRINDNPLLADLCRIEDIRQENTSLFAQTEFRSDANSQWIIGSIFFGWLEKNASNTTETNADGLFRISVPSASKGYILARAARALSSSSEEHYYWIKEIAGTGNEEIMLSSSATVSPQSLADILDLSANTQRSSMSLIQKEFSLVSMDWVSQCRNAMRQIQTNDKRTAMIDGKIRSLEQRVEQVKYESTP
jgi:hypothetical protein